MSPSSGDPTNWDIAKLRDELQRCTETRDKLLRSTSQMRQAVSELEDHLKSDRSQESPWRQQYEEQAHQNRQLEKELKQLQEEVAKQKGDKVGETSKGLQAYDGMSEVALKQLLRKREKEKLEIEWQLKEIEWRLDQESSAVSKAKDEKEALVTQLAQLLIWRQYNYSQCTDSSISQLSQELEHFHATRDKKEGTTSTKLTTVKPNSHKKKQK